MRLPCDSINVRERPWASKRQPIDYKRCCTDRLNPPPQSGHSKWALRFFALDSRAKPRASALVASTHPQRGSGQARLWVRLCGGLQSLSRTAESRIIEARTSQQLIVQHRGQLHDQCGAQIPRDLLIRAQIPNRSGGSKVLAPGGPGSGWHSISTR